jgi:hypothetical protein
LALGAWLLLAVCGCPKEEAPGTPHPIPHAAVPPSPPALSPPVAVAPKAPATAVAAAPPPQAAPNISRWDRGAQALSRDCHATPWEPTTEKSDDARDLADRYRCGDDSDYEQNCSPNECWEGRETCRAACRTGCNGCAKKCPLQCDACAAGCPTADGGECRVGCGVAAAVCQAACFRQREPCYTQCSTQYEACEKRVADDWNHDCGEGCPAVVECCAKATGDDHNKGCPESCWKGKLPQRCADCQWYEQ